MAELPEVYRDWGRYFDISGMEDRWLFFWGLYSEAELNGFASYELP